MGSCCSKTPIKRTDELSQFIRVDGTAYERGVKLGQFSKDSILWLHEIRDKVGYNFLETQWLELARAAKPNIQKYAPITYEEMSGMASVPGLGWDLILKMAVMYEMDMLVVKTLRQPFENIADEFRKVTTPYTGRCSAFGWLDGQQLGGQNNDELPTLFPVDRRADVVYVSTGPDIPPALIYSHPGIPAYFGINSSGLSILTQTLDNDERDHEGGLPTNVMIREVLTKSGMDAALEYLKSVPKTIANSFTLMERDRVCSCEIFLSKVVVREVRKTGWLTHSNHILYAPEEDDTYLRFAVTKTKERLETITEQVKAVYAKGTAALNVASAQQVLSVPPVLNEHTLLKIIFDPVALVAHVWHRWDGLDGFTTYYLLPGPSHL